MASGCTMKCRMAAVVVAFAGVGMFPGGVGSAPGLIVGVADDGFKWRTAEAVAVARDLGVTAARVTVSWHPGETEVAAEDTAMLDRIVGAASGLRLVVSVTGGGQEAPTDASRRADYCTFVRSLLLRYPSVRDVVVWNEANLSMFWQPQYDPSGRSIAPAEYQALLATCWDAVHDAVSDANLITTTSPRGNDNPLAVSNISQSPATFVRLMGAAYRASGRTRPIFDTVGHNVYGHSAERPWKQHFASSHIAEGDLDALLAAVRLGFGGTAQPVPGDCAGCPGVWYLEAGYQTEPAPEKAALYYGQESDAHPVVDRAADGGEVGARDADSLARDQATQFRDGLALAYCQPYVEAIFNFLVWDEPDLARWQSGVLWADGAKKASFDAFRDAAAEVKAGAVDCAAVQRSQLPGPQSSRVTARVVWPRGRYFTAHDRSWSFRLAVRVAADFRASIVRLHRRSEFLRASGSLRPGGLRTIRFSRQTLPAGRYRIEVTVTSATRLMPPTSLVSPQFTIRKARGTSAPRASG
jgi:hypothetical protein